jgi:PII-like signaling protein
VSCGKNAIRHALDISPMTTWTQLSIYTSEASRWGSRSLQAAVIANALDRGLYSAMVFPARVGFGPQQVIPTANQMADPSDLPVEIRIFDQTPAIEAFLATEQAMLQTCIVTLQEVELVQYPNQVVELRE